MRKVAFLVGNDTFPKDPSIPPLRFTQNDAREFAEVLEDRETCGFEARLYLNRPSQEVLTDLDQISGELGQDDTLLFYYSGHGKLRGNELCLVSNETTTTSLGATSIRTRLVLEYLQGSLARRRILILDCCHSGAISSVFKAVDSESALAGLANSFGSYILTASTSIELAEEREKDGHGVFTKALIDCLREGPKERITINDLYDYAHSRLKISAQQTPLFWALQREGPAIEIGNYRARHERERREALGQLIATARTKFDALQVGGVCTQEQVDSILRLLECEEVRLFPLERAFRNNVIRFLKGEVDFISAFCPSDPPIGDPPPRPGPEPPAPDEDDEPPKPLFAAAPIPPEPPSLDPPVTLSAPEVMPGTGGEGGLPEANILTRPPLKALSILAVFVFGLVILTVYFSIPERLAVTQGHTGKSVTASPDVQAPSPIINAPAPSEMAPVKAPSAAATAMAQSTGKPTDPQIADIVYMAGSIGIVTAKLALKGTHTKAVRSFAEEMIRDHEAVNKQVLALLDKLKVTPEGNDTSKAMYREARVKQEELLKLSGTAFDKAYAENEVAYHEAVNEALESVLIPSAQNGELKRLLQTGLKLFQEHEQHAEQLVSALK